MIFGFLTILLLAYLWILVNPIRRDYPNIWLLNPLVFCGLMTFTMGFGVTNIIYFVSPEALAPLGIVPDISESMSKQMLLVILGAIAMSMGYYSRLTIYFCHPVRLAHFKTKYLPSGKLRSQSIFVLTSISIIAGLFTINMGIMGYSSSYEDLIEAGNYAMYLALLGSMGKLALVLAALNYYSHQSNEKKLLLIFIMISQLLFGFISGMKSNVVIPFVILIVCQYLQTGFYSRKNLLIIIVSLFVSYAVIEPFRYARNDDPNFDGTSIVSITNALISPDTSRKKTDTPDDLSSKLLSIVARLNITQMAAPGLVYADENPVLPSGSPQFLRDIFLTPIYAIVPRFIWKSKPLANLGVWYSQVVMGSNHFSSLGMGPFTYLYFAGGYTAVFVGFYIIGTLQRILFMLLLTAKSLPTLLIYMICLPSITMISEFSNIIMFLCRELPLSFLLISIIFNHKLAIKRPQFRTYPTPPANQSTPEH